MEISGDSRDPAIDLLGEWLPLIPGAQARFDVANLDLMIIGVQRRGHDGGRVPLRQDPIRLQVCQNGIEMGEDTGGQPRQCLAGLHQVEIDIGLDLE